MGNCICGGGTLAADHSEFRQPAQRGAVNPQPYGSAPRYRDERLSALAAGQGSPPAPRMFSLSGMAARRPATSARWHTVHWIDYEASEATSADATEPGEICRTTGLDLCLAIAVGGEKVPDFVGEPPAQARLFHILPGNDRAGFQVARYVAGLQRAGYRLQAAIHGGDVASASSLHQLRALRDVLAHWDVPIVLDLAGRAPCAMPGTLSVGVDTDGRLEFSGN